MIEPTLSPPLEAFLLGFLKAVIYGSSMLALVAIVGCFFWFAAIVWRGVSRAVDRMAGR